jgi:hypothetical protein
VKKRSLQVVNEYFERDFNAVWPSAVVFQSFPKEIVKTEVSDGKDESDAKRSFIAGKLRFLS